MSKCGYYSCYKGKPTCSHPENGELYTKCGNFPKQCERCKSKCNGIYPSQLPKAKQDDWIFDVVDKEGNTIIQNIGGK